MNCVRKHLSAIKGGGWLQRRGSPGADLAISDVPGDDPAVIAPARRCRTRRRCRRRWPSLERYGIEIPAKLRERLQSARLETPCRASRGWRRATIDWSPAPPDARSGGGRARRLGIEPLVLGDAIEGEAREVGKALVGGFVLCRHGSPARKPLRAAFRRRDDGDGARGRAGWPQY